MLNLLCCRMMVVVQGCALQFSPWRRPTSRMRGRGVGASCSHAISASRGIHDGGHDSWNIVSCEYPSSLLCMGRLLQLVACSHEELPLLLPVVTTGCARAVRRPLIPLLLRPCWELRELMTI